MEYRVLGRSGLKVSRLCFGALTIGPLQAKLPLREGAAVIRSALDAGVNFIDTGQLYETYPYIREAIQGRDDIIVASKSYAYTYEGMRRDVEQACRETGRDHIDIFMLHEQESRLTLKGHADALAYLVDARAQGMVRAVGVSTHTVEVVEAIADMSEIDVVHPLLNMRGIGIMGGTTVDMLAAVEAAAAAGKGVYTMKALGGGHLIPEADKALTWIRQWESISAVAIGMQSTAEVKLNCAVFTGQEVDDDLWGPVKGQKRRLLVESWCTGCGKCVAKCSMGAISIDAGKAVSQPERCVLCGYCGAYCPDFCIKII